MNFEKYVETVYTADMGYGFRLVIKHHTSQGEHWIAILKDYDDNTGAIGTFRSLDEAMINAREFWKLATDAYEKKHAKYGRMPFITLNGEGALVCELDNENEWHR